MITMLEEDASIYEFGLNSTLKSDPKDTTMRAVHNHVKKHWGLRLFTEVRRKSTITAEKLYSMQDINP